MKRPVRFSRLQILRLGDMRCAGAVIRLRAGPDLKIGTVDYTRVVIAQTFPGLCELLGNETARLASP